MVLSHASFWWQCEGPPEIENIADGGDVAPGEERVLKAESAKAFPVGTTAELGAGVTVKTAEVKPSATNDKILEVPFKVELNARSGPRALTITFPNNLRAVYPNAINVKTLETESPQPAVTEKAKSESAGKTGRKTTPASKPTDTASGSKASNDKALRDTAPLDQK
jgi:hypothetical protein